ncbi:hypothetical protein IGI04_036444 [Brassica rapa subsp. trilocularis]|uniref:Uncharacterized protein n=1 Tax=Brassica rapa subsp. trilocularis TaxID=1813537 RepID=A0ABQ7LHI1_BRACM|nr:hypothetical protein IGI04_036444 [Brassica rapa subsp. trilocularis]
MHTQQLRSCEYVMIAGIRFGEKLQVEMMKLLHMFITSSKPVMDILLITTVGFYIALDGVNLLGHGAHKYLNNVGYYLISLFLLINLIYHSTLVLFFCKDKGGLLRDPENCHKYGMGYVSLCMAAYYVGKGIVNRLRNKSFGFW